MNLLKKFAGYKTYIVGIALLFVGVCQFFGWELPAGTTPVLLGAGLAALRAGVGTPTQEKTTGQ